MKEIKGTVRVASHLRTLRMAVCAIGVLPILSPLRTKVDVSQNTTVFCSLNYTCHRVMFVNVSGELEGSCLYEHSL
uniref:Secreted protein n=1 Tax=Heterorhabditis bacteriophora TaxID=37862 RepID=A0A1I7X575_HETBA